MQELIYNQKDIPRAEHRYGFRASADVGCGWVATHNALRLMGYKTDLHQLIRYYEWQLPLIHGNAGTSFWSPAVCFLKWGYRTELIFDRRRFDEKAREADVCILFYYWRNKLKFGAHFVTVQYKDGKFTGYNTFRTSDGPDDYGTSLERYIQKHKFFGTFLIAIKSKRPA